MSDRLFYFFTALIAAPIFVTIVAIVGLAALVAALADALVNFWKAP